MRRLAISTVEKLFDMIPPTHILGSIMNRAAAKAVAPGGIQ
jgi:hypothetical protein